MDTMQLLIDSHHGIYAYDVLRQSYPLFIRTVTYEPLETYLAKHRDYFGDEELRSIFHPDNDQWCENIDYLESHGLYVQHENGSFWPVQSIDGDIWAINPDAEWNDETETYTLEG